MSNQPASTGFRAKLNEIFSLDVRSLAVFRITLGSFFLVNVIDRWFDLTAHYTDFGISPNWVARHLLTERSGTPRIVQFEVPSIHLLFGDYYWQMLVFALTVVAGLCFVVGYKSRIASVACWLLGISLVNASPLLIYPGDYIMNILLFGSMFIPVGSYWSIDSRKRPAPPMLVSGIQTLPFFVANFLFMLCAGLGKTAGDWHTGVAIQNLMAIEQYSTPMRDYLLPHTGFMKFMTHTAKWIELGLPLCFFIPFFRGAIRMWSVLILIGFLIGIRIFVATQSLSFICAAGLIGLIPSLFWVYVQRFFPRLRGIGNVTPGSAPSSIVNPHLARARFGAILAIVALLFILDWNRLPRFGYKTPKIEVPEWLQRNAEFARLLNNNLMFGDSIRKMRDGWVVVLGKTKAGEIVDLVSGKPNDLSIEQRNNIAEFRLRWRRFFWIVFFNKGSDDRPVFRHLYGQYLCRLWNENNPDNPIEDTIEVIRMDYTYNDGEILPTGAGEGFRQAYSCSEKVALW